MSLVNAVLTIIKSELRHVVNSVAPLHLPQFSHDGRQRLFATMSVPGIHRDRNNYHPESEADIIILVNYARANACQVLERGSGHSMPQATFTDACVIDEVDVPAAAPEANVNRVLDRYDEIVSLDETTKRVPVQSGIHLGRDQENSREQSSSSTPREGSRTGKPRRHLASDCGRFSLHRIRGRVTYLQCAG